MNQNSGDSSWNILVKEVEVAKDVGDMLESWLNKAKEMGEFRNNISIVKYSRGTMKDRLTKMNP